MRNHQTEISSNQAEIRNLQADVTAAHHEADRWEQMALQLEATVNKQHEELVNLRSEHNQASTELADVSAQLQSAATQREAQQSELSEASRRLQQLADRCLDLEKKLKIARTAHADSQGTSDALEGQLAAKLEEFHCLNHEASETSKQLAALHAEIHSLREAKLEAEYASASQTDLMQHAIVKLESELAAAHKASACLLASQHQLQTELNRAAEVRHEVDTAQSLVMQLQEQIRTEQSRARQLQKSLQTEQNLVQQSQQQAKAERSRALQLQQQLEVEQTQAKVVQQQAEAETSRAQLLRQQLQQSHSEADRLSVALDSIQAASSSSQAKHVTSLSDDDHDPGCQHALVR